MRRSSARNAGNHGGMPVHQFLLCWLLPTIAGFVNRQQASVIDFLREENWLRRVSGVEGDVRAQGCGAKFGIGHWIRFNAGRGRPGSAEEPARIRPTSNMKWLRIAIIPSCLTHAPS
jgi:hypothetical protein